MYHGHRGHHHLSRAGHFSRSGLKRWNLNLERARRALEHSFKTKFHAKRRGHRKVRHARRHGR